jgi:hypothetical protein
LDKVIEKAVSDFYNDRNRTVVTVNHTNLARIREEALETQGSLMVEEDGFGNKNESELFISSVDSRFDSIEPPPLTLSFADGWKALKNALTDMERQALSLTLQENSDLKTFATNSGVMLEVLLDSINEKAADCIGDNLLEVDDGVVLYDEYRENVEAICRARQGDGSSVLQQGVNT